MESTYAPSKICHLFLVQDLYETSGNRFAPKIFLHNEITPKFFKRFLMAQSWGCQQIPRTEKTQGILRSTTKYSALTVFSDLPFNYGCSFSLFFILAVISC